LIKDKVAGCQSGEGNPHKDGKMDIPYILYSSDNSRWHCEKSDYYHAAFICRKKMKMLPKQA